MTGNLEFIRTFDKMNVEALSWDSVFEYFFFSEKKILFIVDSTDKLLGVITLGNIINAPDDVKKAINADCLSVKSAPIDEMLSEAQKIYDTYGIKSEIPVIEEGKLTGCIINHKILSDREAAHAGQIKEAQEKIRFFAQSHYLKKELEAFRTVLGNTEIYARQCDAYHAVFSMLGDNLKCHMLSDAEYIDKVKALIANKDSLDDGQKTELILDFESENGEILCRRWKVCVYSLEKFIHEFNTLVETEEFSRLVRITSDSRYELKHAIHDNGIEQISFAANKLLTKYVYDYMKRNHIPISLSDANDVSAMRGSSLISGRRGGAQDLINFSACDLEQYYILNQALANRNISVFNIQGAVNAKMTETEKARLDHFKLRGIMILNKDYEELERLYKDDCGDQTPYDYAKSLFYLFPLRRRFENDIIVNVDCHTPYINIDNGVRRTCYQPEMYTGTIYVLGPCTALGPYVEDRHTIPSLLSKRLAENGFSYRVVNLGILSSNNCLNLLDSLTLRDGDIFINLIYTEQKDYIGKLIDIIDISDAFNQIPDRDDMFFEKTVHCNRKGNEVYADAIYQCIKPALQTEAHPPLKNNVYDIFKTNKTDLFRYEIPQYLDLLREESLKIPKDAKEIGAIVMNCNPFTLGHKHLVEYAAQRCDYLFVLVVSTDTSFFKFKDRFAIAAENCKAYENVRVIPSGRAFASNITFPEYFQRGTKSENKNKNKKTSIQSNITGTLDIRTFATYVAPLLGITIRFIGEEPTDPVTGIYNEDIKNVCSLFNIAVDEIPRKESADGEVISASWVRKMYQSRNFTEMKRMLPDVTWQYLVDKADDYLTCDMRGYKDGKNKPKTGSGNQNA